MRKYSYIVRFISFFLSLFLIAKVSNAKDLVRWKEFASSENGIQFVDEASMKLNSKDNIELTSIFKPYKTLDESEVKQELFSMEIDCKRFLYKDNSINGVINTNAKWKESNGDSLIEEVIRISCSREYT